MVDIKILLLVICSFVFVAFIVTLVYLVEKIKKIKILRDNEQKLNLEVLNNQNQIAYLLDVSKDYQLLKNQNSDFIVKNSNNMAKISSLETSLIEKNEQLDKLIFEKDDRIDYLNKKLESLSLEFNELQNTSVVDKETISNLRTLLDEQRKYTEERISALNESEDRLKVEFENLASKIFENNSRRFSEENQKSLGLILMPVKEQLVDFKKTVENVYEKEARDRTILQNELKSLKELNSKMSSEAHNLALALKADNKQQGMWGEVVLEKVLENSGLRKDYEYRREVSLQSEDGDSFRPDVIVDLPNNRQIIIDSKTSLNDYVAYVNALDKNEKDARLRSHIICIKEHIKKLSTKQYENLKGVNTLDLVLMFIPIESALLLALDGDVSLYDEAFKQKIILVSPTTLLVALRAIENIWRYERQAQNIKDVYKKAEELYKKIGGFVEDFEKVGKSLDGAKKSYDEAFSKLSTGRGNLISQATMLKKLSNIKPKKELDSILVETAMLSDDSI